MQFISKAAPKPRFQLIHPDYSLFRQVNIAK